MFTRAWQYALALWHQWRALLMGGTLMALAVIFALATGNALSRPWGWGILALTLLFASFGAWREEREKNDAARPPRMQITHVGAYSGEGQTLFSLYVHLTNPSPEPTSFDPVWMLDVLTMNGKSVKGIRGSMHGTVRPMQQGDQFDVSIVFPYSPLVPDAAFLSGAAYTLTGSDIFGRHLQAEYPPR